ncbi:MAG: hybrid sensor histidine kinase/response regulator [Candidatus Kapaibacterium sp.]|nr:MAG: hybrid sensor histidine kinase/response regulator [Candidatus Kapabacteria bacterium]
MRTRKVVIIDDDSTTLETIEHILMVYNFAVFTANGGTEGIGVVQRTQPDIILCDVIMHDMSGFEVLAELRKHSATATIPILMLSAKHELTDIRTGMQLGADDFLTKPFSVDDLLSSINTRLEKHERITYQANQQLKQLRENIALVLPHEFRTPLNSIIGFGELLTSQYDRLERSEAMEMLTTMVSAGYRLSVLVENFIYLSRLEILAANPSAMKELSHEKVLNCSEIIMEMAWHSVMQNSHQHQLDNDVQPASLAISDAYLRKLILELIDNACKFSPPKSCIRLHGRLRNGFYTLAIHDQGRGMNASQIAQIGAYMQFDRNIHEQQGQGLGLAIAKRITELHKGSFMIDSTLGKGTTVEVRLPTVI